MERIKSQRLHKSWIIILRKSSVLQMCWSQSRVAEWKNFIYHLWLMRMHKALPLFICHIMVPWHPWGGVGLIWLRMDVPFTCPTAIQSGVEVNGLMLRACLSTLIQTALAPFCIWWCNKTFFSSHWGLRSPWMKSQWRTSSSSYNQGKRIPQKTFLWNHCIAISSSKRN